MRARQRVATLLTIFVICSALLFGSAATSIKPVYGHGFSHDEAMLANLGNRLATVSVDMKPSALFAEAPQEAIITIRFFDKNADANIQHVTFFLKMKKGDKTIMMDWFHTHKGSFAMKVRPANTERVTIDAVKEPILDGWIGEVDAPALATGPIFTQGGLYRFEIEVYSIDTDKTLLDPPIKTNAYVSIGETTTFALADGSETEIAVRTYYDQIQKFEFDETGNLIKFTMPMNWDKNYLALVPLVHEEVVIPRSLSELVADKYTATLNGVRLPDRSVMVDTSNPEEVIVHYMIPNQQLLQLADHVATMSPGATTAEFTLVPGTVETGMPLADTGGMGGQAMAMSTKSTYHIMLDGPPVIEPGKLAPFVFSLMDARSGAMLDASYTFVIVKDGKELVRRSGNAVGGVAGEVFTFTESQTGKATLRLDNINNSGEYAEFEVVVGGATVTPPPQMPPMKMIDVSVAVKQTKKLTLISVKNNEQTPVYGVQLKLKDGEVKFVKAKGWDRDRVDKSTVLVSTKDMPLLPGRPLIILLLGTDPSASLEWTMLDQTAAMLGSGTAEPKSM